VANERLLYLAQRTQRPGKNVLLHVLLREQNVSLNLLKLKPRLWNSRVTVHVLALVRVRRLTMSYVTWWRRLDLALYCSVFFMSLSACALVRTTFQPCVPKLAFLSKCRVTVDLPRRSRNASTQHGFVYLALTSWLRHEPKTLDGGLAKSCTSFEPWTFKYSDTNFVFARFDFVSNRFHTSNTVYVS
jgi:hypothetical protein